MATKQYTIGYVSESNKRVWSAMSVKFGIDVCCVKDEQTQQYRIFAHCSAQLAKRMSDFMDGWVLATKA